MGEGNSLGTGPDGSNQRGQPGIASLTANKRRYSLESSIQIILLLLGMIAACYVAWFVFSFQQSSGPVIEYEEITGPLTEDSAVCPGQQYQFIVSARARRAPAVVAIVENWVDRKDPRNTLVDSELEWRIVSEPINGEFIVTSRVPPMIQPGAYIYQRALGLTRPLVLEMPIIVKNC